MPWITRPAISVPADCDARHASPPSTKSASPTSSTGRRPSRSDAGPYTSCVPANATMKSVTESCIVPLLAPSSRESVGSDGISMSTANGAIAESATSSAAAGSDSARRRSRGESAGVAGAAGGTGAVTRGGSSWPGTVARRGGRAPAHGTRQRAGGPHRRRKQRPHGSLLAAVWPRNS